MNDLSEAYVSDGVAQASEGEIPSAFRRAFEPTPGERAARFILVVLGSLSNWLHSQAEQAWLPRATDPMAELKHVYLGEYGVLPAEFSTSAARRCCPDLPY